MLTYTPARTLSRGVHAVARCSNRRPVAGSPMSPNFAPCGAVFFYYSSPGALTTTRTRLPTSRDESTCGTRGNSLFAGARAFNARPTTRSSLRCLSSSTPRLFAEGKDGRETTARQSQSGVPPPLPPAERKGIRKVLPSLTPHENIYTVPNLLTFSRLVAAPFIGYAILHDAHALALGLFAYAGVSDLLDGWIARRWKLQTVVGSVVDPMADKMLMTVLTVCLAMQGALPVWLAAIILGRDVGLGIAAIYYRWISLPPPKTFTRYWDFSLPSAEVRPTTISKYNTFLQLGLMGATMVAPVVAVDVSSAMTVFQYLVATTTVWSGLSYVFTKDAVRILSESNEQKKKP
ncbi:CDP-alcohol phosphatidyltransferase-domain-containing protein [Xylaria castorea]|nr:CDP-alcohol phosphatidyltransferase-domain-containing protein [Xylaria castorea]